MVKTGPAALASIVAAPATKTDRPGEPPRVRHVVKPLWTDRPHHLQNRQRQNDHANDWLVDRFIQPSHHDSGDDHADTGRRQHAPHVAPSCVLMKDADGADVTNKEHWQQNAGRLARAKEEREDQHLHEAHAREPRFRHADTQCRDHCEQPLDGGEVRQEDC